MASLSLSLSTSSSIISLLLSTLLFAVHPISAYPIDNICKQTQNPNFCFNLLKPHASSNLQELDAFVIDATTTSVTKASSKVQSLLPKTNDPNLKMVYSFCSNYYSAALSALAAAKEKLKARDFRAVKSAAETVSTDAASCRRAFAFAPSQPIAIAGENNEFELFSNVFVVVSGKL